MIEIPIEKLNLSARASHILHRMGIDTIDKLSEISADDVARERSAGVKTVDELKHVIAAIHNGEIDVEGIRESMIIEESFHWFEKKYTDQQLDDLSHFSIDELDLSNRSYNCLKKYEITSIALLMETGGEQLKHLKGLGKNSYDEIVSSLENWLKNNTTLLDLQLTDPSSLISQQEEDYFRKIALYLSPLMELYWKRILEYAEDSQLKDAIVEGGYEAITDQNMIAVFGIPEIEGQLFLFLDDLIPEGHISEDELIRRFEDLHLLFDSNILLHKCKESFLIETADSLLLTREKLRDYLNEYFLTCKERERIVLEERLSGKTLEDIGNRLGITRERTRQIADKAVKRFPLLYEDYYSELFSFFSISREEFCHAFPDADEITYNYLSCRYKRGKLDLSEESLSDYHGLFKNELRFFFENDMSMKEKKSTGRMNILHKILLSHVDSSLTIEQLKNEYRSYVLENDYPLDKLQLSTRTVVNHLRNTKHIVFDKENKVRYCPFDEEEILTNINFQQYRDIVLSSDLIWQENIDLMKEQDIRDGYELFYVVKSMVNQIENQFSFPIHPRRVPVIVMGNADEAMQALDLLKEMSPVSVGEYYLAYQDIFGIRHDSAQANPVIQQALSPYYNDGYYEIDVPVLEETDAQALRAAMYEKPFWFEDDLRSLYSKVCVHSQADAFNYAAFKRIGYVLNSGYAYSSEYKNVAECIKMMIFNRDVVDLNTIDKRFFRIQIFNTILDNVKKSLEYIETAHKRLLALSMIQKIYGMDKKEIRELQELLGTYSFEKKYFNAESLWDEIRDLKLMKKLKENKWLCNSIMRQQEGINSRYLSGTYILAREISLLNINEICLWIAENEGRMSIDRLTNRFNEIFGTNLESYKIAEKLKLSEHWTDIVTDALEADLEELFVNEEDIEPSDL